MARKQEPEREALSFLRKATGQVSAVRRALEQSVEDSMAAPGGMEWEHQVSEPEEPEPAGPAPTPPPWEQERRRRTAAEFVRNWFGPGRRRRK